MNIFEAKRIAEKYYFKPTLTEDEAFTMIEALEYLIAETKDPDYMTDLGGYYYEQKDFDLALKYYEMADSYGHSWAPEGLGYIWYYGRTGQRDYEKAFKYYSKAAKNGYLRSEMKVADMYKNGYYVEKDYDKYCEIIEDLFQKVLDGYGRDEQNDIAIRLAKIRKEQGRVDEAITLFLNARAFLAEKIEYNPFFGDLNVMKWLIDDLYELIEVDLSDLDLYDLYYLMKEPCKVEFLYEGKTYEVESFREEEGVSVYFLGKWYRDIDEFFKKAKIDGERVPVLFSRLYGFKKVD